MVSLFDKFFGRYDDEYEELDEHEEMPGYDFSYEEPEAVVQPEPESVNETASLFDRFSNKNKVKPERERKSQGRVLNMNRTPEIDYNQEVVVMIPSDFEMTKQVCDYIKSGKTVICNIEKIDNETAQRVLDFILGATYSLGGSLESVSNKIFVVTPHSTRLSMRMEDARDESLSSRHSYGTLRNSGMRREQAADQQAFSGLTGRFHTIGLDDRKVVNQ